MGEFVRRRLGKEALDKIAEPLMSGIHVSDPEQQSLLATFPRFRNLEQKYGSLIKGMLASRKLHPAPKQPSKTPNTAFITLQDGLGQMVKALEKNLTDGLIFKGQRVQKLERLPEGQYCVELQNGATVTAEAVILATPAYVSAGLLQSFAPDVAGALSQIRYVSTATVSLGFHKKDITNPFMGFGYVVPKKEKRQVSACTWTSFKFDHRAPEGHLLLRCFMGGPGMEEYVDLSDEAMLKVVREELKNTLKITAEPVVTRIFRWHKANPQYGLGHLERVKDIFNQLGDYPGLYLTGSAYEGVGVPDCIHQGQQTADKVIAFLSQEDTQTVQSLNAPVNSRC